MSAQHAAEMLVAFAQAASYHQGQEAAYAEAMRLVRNIKIQAPNLPMSSVVAMLERTELVLYDKAQENMHAKDKRNRATRATDEGLTAADRAITSRL